MLSHSLNFASRFYFPLFVLVFFFQKDSKNIKWLLKFRHLKLGILAMHDQSYQNTMRAIILMADDKTLNY